MILTSILLEEKQRPGWRTQGSSVPSGSRRCCPERRCVTWCQQVAKAAFFQLRSGQTREVKRNGMGRPQGRRSKRGLGGVQLGYFRPRRLLETLRLSLVARTCLP